MPTTEFVPKETKKYNFSDNSTDNSTLTCSAPTIDNANVSPNDTVEVGESFNVFCEDGFNLSGNATVECYENATLSTAPLCIGLNRRNK